MKLAEALTVRADLSTRFSQLKRRAAASALHQEGEQPAEDPNEILAEADRVADELERLIARINATNMATEVGAGLTLTAALARRDTLRMRHRFRSNLAESATQAGNRWTRSELRMVRAVDVQALHREVDQLARELRELDTRIQEVNWSTELIE